MNVLSSKCGQVTGVRENVRSVAGDIVADFGCKCPLCGQPEIVSVAFPGRAREKIEAHVGQRVTVLRNGEDYLVRVAAEPAHLPQEVRALASSCSSFINTSTLSDGSRPTHLIDAEEVYGTLRSIMSLDDETVIAQIGPRAVLLPASLKLLAVGLRICVLRLDDEYYVRGLPS